MSTYVISDVHGDYEAYLRILEKINFSDSDVLYVNGDVIDRGFGSIKILQHMMMQPNIYPILVNHEYAAGTCLRFLMNEITEESVKNIDENMIKSIFEWQNIGGQRTIDEFHKLSMEEKMDIVEYLEEFALYEDVSVKGKKFVIVHAGLMNFIPERPLDDYEIYELIFKAPNYEEVYFEDRYLVTGHLPTKAIHINPRPNKIFVNNNHICIDCGSGYDGTVGCICLDTFEEFYA
jgi:serine/threonine protein phosphatase 1